MAACSIEPQKEEELKIKKIKKHENTHFILMGKVLVDLKVNMHVFTIKYFKGMY